MQPTKSGTDRSSDFSNERTDHTAAAALVDDENRPERKRKLNPSSASDRKYSVSKDCTPTPSSDFSTLYPASKRTKMDMEHGPSPTMNKPGSSRSPTNGMFLNSQKKSGLNIGSNNHNHFHHPREKSAVTSSKPAQTKKLVIKNFKGKI